MDLGNIGHFDKFRFVLSFPNVLVSFMILDFVKVFIISKWSFELTAKLWPVPSRKNEVARRKQENIRLDRINGNMDKVRKAGKAIYACSLFRQAGIEQARKKK
jgi:H+-transporting ATPase